MSSGASANIVLKGDNPFEVDRNHYSRLSDPVPGLESWSETYYWSVWDPKHEVGVYIHMGVDAIDKHLWWAQVFAYLPGGMAVADRSWGRSADRLGPTTGNFSARCVEPLRRWTLKFDGAGELVSCAEMATRLVGAGAPVPMSFDIEWTATMPVWDLFKAVPMEGTDIGHIHHEQVGIGKGVLRIGDKQFGGEWQLDGMAFRDHSSGHRDVTPFGGDHLLGVYFPKSGRSLQAVIFWDKDGKFILRAASIHQGDEIELIPEFDMTGVEMDAERPTSLHDLEGNPKQFKMHLNTRQGRVELLGEIVHTINVSLFGGNTNVNGSAINIPGDHMLLAECQARLTWPDGDVGYGFFERTYKKSLLAKAKS